jgi:gamma-glutamylcysteine synthetase
MTTATATATADVSRLRSQLTLLSRHAESAFERAFDLQQSGAPAERVDAALAEVTRLQASVRELHERLGVDSVLH